MEKFRQDIVESNGLTKLFQEIKADYLVPMHYESWNHFTQFGQELQTVFQAEGISDRVCWLKGGQAVKVL